MSSRDFSMSGEIAIPQRRIDNGAPDHLRIELVSSVFALADNDRGPSEQTLYNGMLGTLGVISAVEP